MSATQKITRDDLKAKLVEIQDEASRTVEQSRQQLVAVGVTVAAVVIAAAFLLGRRGGRRQSTIIELKRV